MPGGTCYLSIVPVKAEPSAKSELVNQLLFGDRVEILQEAHGWYQIVSLHDQYEGWCEINQITLTDIPKEQKPESLLIHDITARFSDSKQDLILLLGSEISMTAEKLVVGNQTYSLVEGNIGPAMHASGVNLVKTGRKLLNSPYLWGGRSPFGIDCSGLIQIAFKLIGVKMPRDAWQQAESRGEFIDLMAETRSGDIAFFDNAEGRIVHTGILTGEGTIVHAHGKVREDPVDHNGIFNRETGSYSHKLRIIKRFTI